MGCKYCNRKPENFVTFIMTDLHSVTAPTLKIQRCLRVGTLGEDARIAARTQFRICAPFHHNCETLHLRLRHFQASRRLISSGIWIIARASVGVAHIDLIELVVECLPIVHLAVKTA